jgi:cell division protein FtsN
MKNILFLLCFSFLLCSGCKFFRGKSAKTVDTITADTTTEEIVDSADLYTGISSGPVSQSPVTTQQTTVPVSSYGRTNAESGRYYMIVGCFTVQNNADRFVEKLRGMGYSPQILTGNGNFQMVAAQSYNSYRESVADIDKFRNEVTPNAWVYMQK